MTIRKKYVYDLITRITHAGIGGSALLLFLTAKIAEFYYENGQISHLMWTMHIYLGYTLCAFLALRLVWFFKGPKYSKISNFIKIKQWSAIVQNFWHTKKLQPIPWGWGHHPTAAIAYLMVYLSLLILIVSGVFLAGIEMDIGPAAKKYYDELALLDFFMLPHNRASWFIIAFTALHLASLLWHQLKDKVPTFKSMWNGYQYKHSSDGDFENECD